MKARWLLLLLAGLLACGAALRPRLVAPLSYAAVPAPPDEPFRNTPPAAGPLDATPMFTMSKAGLDNGLELLLLPRRGLPVVTAALVIARGSRDLPGTRPELLDLAMDAIVREQQSAPGAAPDVHPQAACSADGCVVTVLCLSAAFERAMKGLADIATRPRYTAAAEARLRADWKSRMDFRGGIEDVVENNAKALLFARGDPYGPVPDESAVDLGGVSIFRLRHLHAQLFQPGHATLVVAGDVAPEALRTVAERAFGDWKGTKPTLTMSAATSPMPERAAGIVLVDRDGDLVHAYVVGRAPAGNEPALDAMGLLGESLAAPMGRLHDEVRQNLGAAYDLRFQVSTGRTGSWFRIGGAFEPSLALPAITAVLEAVRKVRENGLSAAEMEAARARAVTGQREDMGTSYGAMAMLANAILSAAPPTSILARQGHITALTSADLRRFAQVWLAEPMLRVVVVGEASRLAQPFGTLGLGPMEWRTLTGQPIRH